MYFFTNAIMVSLSISGNSIIVLNILQNMNINILENGSDLDNQRIIGLITLVIVSAIPFISLDFEAKTQWILFTIVVLAFADFIIGAFLPPTEYQEVNGFVGWSGSCFTTNLLPQWNGYTFFTMFSIYLSGLCGDFTGVTMASSVRNPKVSIPKGSLLGIFTTQLLYVIQMIWFTSTSNRYATGNLADYQYNNYTCDLQQNCVSGCSNNPYMMSIMSSFTYFTNQTHHIEPIFSAGLLSQSMSSAMIAFISAPRMLQSLGFDELLPYIKWFSKPYGTHADPRRGYILTFIVSVIFVGISEFTILATITSICYLCAWGLVNVACFHCDYVKGSDWRPLFRYYNKWCSLLTGLVCFAFMFAIEWYIGLALTIFMVIIYIIMIIRKSKVSWGETPISQLYKTTVSLGHKLNRHPEHTKTFRPSVLLLSGVPMNNKELILMADHITRHRGMLFIGDIVCSDLASDYRLKATSVWNQWFTDNKIKCFYKLVTADTIGAGSNMLIQCCGFGNNLSPNVVMLGFRNSWKQCTNDEIVDYFTIIHQVFEMRKSLIIYRDHKKSKHFIEKQKDEIRLSKQLGIMNAGLNATTLRGVSKLSFIDIYWLYDDGGLTLLIPYILSERKKWKKCKLRIFVIVDEESNDIIKMVSNQNP
ncbi:unnamed protein product [Oppiella nova]|uniref:Uncharacterized protein n=1 Tax=Oppiella nova TaxID=334625 RepID=A0A7R9M4H0_9ACAR|nr:unnamed protein product [Oppiella nova]CAG2169274.1 unnamed protein product [Oppiella nova]